ncbi:transposase [Streptomyces alanosinicus]|uniref:transposase n=1 Tax=Streptomyces alanosinicus TaxID=68171 RepID=UPI00167919FD|nr:transposase [Streptomyces alanosinicus]
MIETGKPIPEVAEELGVHPRTLHSWVSRRRRNRSASSHRSVPSFIGAELAPPPAAAAKLSTARIETALRRADRIRGVKESAAELRTILQRPHLRQDPLVEQAMGTQAQRLLATLDAECVSVDQLADACLDAFRQHPDYEVITSFPGLADLSGARVLADIGDDRARFADARCLKAFAGSAPVTRTSGRSTVVTHRRVKNDRLASVGFTWAFSALVGSPGARAHYDRRRAAGDRHAAALRNLFNRFLGCLYHCLQYGDLYAEMTAFPILEPVETAAA